MPVDPVSAFGGFAARCLSTGAGGMRVAGGDPPPGRAGTDGRQTCATHAQSANPDASADPTRDYGPDGTNGLGHCGRHPEGERNPSRLAQLRDPRVKASPETIEKSLVGHWQPEHLFTLKQSRRLYAEYQREIGECDAEIERLVGTFQPRVDPEVKPLPPDQKKRNRNYAKSRKRRARPQSSTREFDLRTEVYKLYRVDVTQIPGLEFLALQLFSELGRDMSRWASAAQFVSWLA